MPPLQILGPPTSSPSGTGWERPEYSTPRNPARKDPPELCNCGPLLGFTQSILSVVGRQIFITFVLNAVPGSSLAAATGGRRQKSVGADCEMNTKTVRNCLHFFLMFKGGSCPHDLKSVIFGRLSKLNSVRFEVPSSCPIWCFGFRRLF